MRNSAIIQYLVDKKDILKTIRGILISYKPVVLKDTPKIQNIHYIESYEIYLMILLNHSPIFQNFLLYNTQNTLGKVSSSLISNITIIPSSKNPYITTHAKNVQENYYEIIIYLPKELIIELTEHYHKNGYFCYSRHMLASEEHIHENSTDVLEEIVQNYNYEETKEHAQIIKKYIKYPESSLDYILNKFKQFRDLNIEIKKRILNLEFTNIVIKEYNPTLKNIEKLAKQIKKGMAKKQQKILDEISSNIEHLQNRLEEANIEYNKIVNEIISIEQNDLKKDKIQRVLSNSQINNVYQNDHYLYIQTNPLILNYDEKKKHAHDRLKKLKENEKLTIGRHEIKIDLNTFSPRYRPLDKIRNHHIENLRCFGTFGEHIQKAQRERNLAKLVSLNLQLIRHVTIGDPTGNNTIDDALLVDKNNMIHYNDTKYYFSEFFTHREAIENGTYKSGVHAKDIHKEAEKNRKSIIEALKEEEENENEEL